MKLLRSGVRKLSSIRMPGGWQLQLDETTVAAMSTTLAEGGVLPPLVLDQDDRLVAGRNRYEAHRRVGLTEVRCDSVEFEDREEADILAVRENLDRKRLTPERLDQETARLVALYAIRLERQRTADSEKSPSQNGPGRPETPRAEAVRQVAEQEKVTPRAINQRIARAEGKADQQKEQQARGAPARQEPEAGVPAEGTVPAAIEDRRRRARALKAMAVLLRKVEAHIHELDGLEPAHRTHIGRAVAEAQAAVFDASVAEGSNSLQMQTGEGERVQPCAPDEPGEAKGATLSPGESESRPSGESVSASRAPVALARCCKDGCHKPACPPSKVLCREHLDALDQKMHEVCSPPPSVPSTPSKPSKKRITIVNDQGEPLCIDPDEDPGIPF